MILPIIFLAGLFFVPSTLGGCVEDSVKDGNFMTCIVEFSGYLSENMDPSDPTSAVTAMCSEAGKMKVQCLINYLKNCPELLSIGEENPQMSGTFDMVANLDSMCSMTTGKCSKIQECMVGLENMASEPSRGDMGNMDSSHDPTPFNAVQTMIGQLCGPIGDAFKCLEGYKDECPETMNMMNTMMRGYGGSQSGPTIDDVNMFIKDECPKIPNTFSTNSCVKKQLEDQQFVECFEKVDRLKSATDTDRCQRVRAGMKCFDMYVGMCGKREVDILIKSVFVFIEAPPPNCQAMNDRQKGGASTFSVSIATIIISSLLTFF